MLTYDMTKHGDASLYEYLYTCIKRDIERGVIVAQQHLPSKRKLAAHLGVSVITVEGAYSQLAAEGYIVSQPRRGYFASDLGDMPRLSSSAALDDCTQHSKITTADEHFSSQEVGLDLTGAASAEGLFPYMQWSRTLRQVLSEESETSMTDELSPMGSPRLRKALVGHLRQFRGIDVSPEQIVVGAGAQTLYGMIVQLLGRDLHYAVEEPGYPRLTRIYNSNNVSLSHVYMDETGIDMAQLRACNPQVVHVMPSHQFPLGLVYAVSRRYDLLGWAAEEAGRWIIEDDFDCEFRLSGKPIPALRSIDAQGCVIYTNTFTKTLGPAFRIGYMVLPVELVEVFEDKLGFYSCSVGVLEQLTLARFIESGNYERHLNRLRNHYKKTSSRLVAALHSASFGSRISITGEDAGIHFVLHVKPKIGDRRSELQVAKDVFEAGVHIQPLDSFRLEGKPSTEECWTFVVSLGGLREGDIAGLVDSLEGTL